MTQVVQSNLEASGIEWPAFRYPIPCMAHIIHLSLCAFMGYRGLKGCAKSWEAHERNQQFGQNECIDIGKSQWLRKEGNSGFNTVSAMIPGLAKIFWKQGIWRDFQSGDTDIQKAANACCIDYADTESSKWVHWMSISQSANPITTDSGWEDTMDIDAGVSWASLLITSIQQRVAQGSKIH